MSNESLYRASCFCGEVEFTLRKNPEAMAYCHCDSCRHWSASPVSAFTLWQPSALEITKGANNIASFDKNPGSENQAVVSQRKWCKSCGGHLFTEHPAMGLVDVPASVIKSFTFKPEFHVHYQETIHQMKDGLPKFKDIPEAAGGTGEIMTE